MSRATFKTLPPGARVVENTLKSAANPPPRPDPTQAAPPTPPDPPAPVRGKKTMQFRYQAATGEHTKQYPAYFRIVVEGPIEEQAAVEAALENLKQNKL